MRHKYIRMGRRGIKFQYRMSHEEYRKYLILVYEGKLAYLRLYYPPIVKEDGSWNNEYNSWRDSAELYSDILNYLYDPAKYAHNKWDAARGVNNPFLFHEIAPWEYRYTLNGVEVLSRKKPETTDDGCYGIKRYYYQDGEVWFMYAIIRAHDVSECCTLVTHGVFRITKGFQETMRARLGTLQGIKTLITCPDSIEFEDYSIEFFKQDVFEKSNPAFYNFLEEMEGCILFDDSAIPDSLIEICDGKEQEGHERIGVSLLRQKWHIDRPLEPEWIGYADAYYPVEVYTEDISVKEILEVKL